MNKDIGQYFITRDKNTYEVVIGLEVHAQVLSNSKLFSSSIERTATRRNERRKKEEFQKSESFPPFEEDANSRWAIPQGTQMKTRLCTSCSTYNAAESNYCSSCGSLIA